MKHFLQVKLSWVIALMLISISLSAQPSSWTFSNTGVNHTILIQPTVVTIDGIQLSAGDYIGVFFTQGSVLSCGGFVGFTGSTTALTAWGTEAGMNNGFAAGETFTWKVWRAADGLEIDMVATYSAGFPNAGTYTTNGMSSLASLTGSAPSTSLSASFVPSDVSCNGACDGSIDVTVDSGTAPYSFEWSNGATTEDLAGLCPGTYDLTVTDSGGAGGPTGSPFDWTFNNTGVNHTVLLQPNTITIDGSSIAMGDIVGAFYQSSSGLACGGYAAWAGTTTAVSVWGTEAGLNNGFAAGEAFTWKLWRASDAVTIDMSATYNPGFPNQGTYTTNGMSAVLTMTGSAPSGGGGGTTTNLSVTITQPIQLIVLGVVSDYSGYSVSTNGATDGSVDLSVFGGTSPYTFVWSNNTFNEDLLNVGAGTYTVTVLDANGCMQTETFVLSEPAATDPLAASGVVLNNFCFGDCNGTIDLSVSGSTPPYNITWSNQSIMEDLSGLCAGSYSVTVTAPATSESVFLSFTVTEPDQISVSGTVSSISCFGYNNGWIDINVSGGTFPYTFMWSSTQTTEDLIGLFSGMYTVTVTDANGCFTTGSYEILEPAAMMISGVITDLGCVGTNNGEVDITVSGGSMPYTYLWSNSYTNEDLTGVTSGTYTVTVTDVQGCTISDTYVVNDASEMVLSTVISNATCNGNSDGAIDLTVTLGASPYTYLWFNSTTNEDITGLAAGNYGVTVSDNNGCSTTGLFEVSQPEMMSVSGVVMDATCNAPTDGSVDLSVSGGTIPYTYFWSNQTTGGPFQSGFSPGYYEVTVTDVNGCTASNGFTIGSPDQLTLSAVVTDLTCGTSNDGAVDLTVSGGALPYTFDWSNSANTEDITGLWQGTYSVTVTDVNGCISTESWFVADGTDIILSYNITGVSCFGNSDGAIDLTITGGIPPFSYLYSNGATTEDISGLAAATYDLTVTYGPGCVALANLSLSEPDEIILTGVVTDASTYGGSDGSIDITVTGGSNFTYLWSNGSTTEDLNGQIAGTYGVTVTHFNGCNAFGSYTIYEPVPPSLMASVAWVNNTSCNNYCDGTIDIDVTGGVPPYSYLWSNGATNEDLVSLCPGTYDLTVTDSGGSGPTGEPFTWTWSNTGANHTILVDAGTVTIDGSPIAVNDVIGVFYQGSSGLQCGGYGVWTGAVTAVTAWGTEAGLNNGFASGEAFTWKVWRASDGVVIDMVATYNPVFPNTGTYVTNGMTSILTMTGNAPTGGGTGGDTYSLSVTITAPAAIMVSGVISDYSGYSVSDFGASDGSIDITVSGGVAPYTYLWNNGATTEDISGLTAGEYNVVITDANNCTGYASYTLTQQEFPTFSVNGTATDVSCFGVCDGSIDLMVTGGVPPYTYLWNGGQTNQNLSSLCPGQYDVTVTDSGNSGTPTYQQFNWTYANTGNNHTILISVGTITIDGSPLNIGDVIGVFYNNAGTMTCGGYVEWLNGPTAIAAWGTESGMNNGFAFGEAFTWKVWRSVQGDIVDMTAAYETFGFPNQGNYSTNGMSSLASLAGNATIGGGSGSSISLSFTIYEPTELMLSGLLSDYSGFGVSLYGASDGSIDISVTGGTSPYTYLWSNQSTNEDLFNLSAGNYMVTVTDANGCVVTGSFDLTEPPPAATLEVFATLTHVTCFGENNGIIDLFITGGVSPYTVEWSNSSTTQDIFNLVSGTYSVTVTDQYNSTFVESYTINEPVELTLTGTTVNVLCNGDSDGSIDITVMGGTMPYTYLWSNTYTDEDLTGLVAYTYEVTATDANGCFVTGMFTVTEPTAELNMSATSVDASCFGLADGSIDATTTGGTPPYSYTWNNGLTVEDPANVAAGYYEGYVTDANGCSTSLTYVTVNEPAELMITGTYTDAACFGGSDGTIDITVTGGTMPYTYSWSNQSTDEDLMGLGAGTYEVIVTDANGCMVNASYTITEPTELMFSALVYDVTCFGLSDGWIDVTVSGGTAPYSYGDFTGLVSGTYEVIVTDANGCMTSGFYTVNEPAELMASGSYTDVTCFGGSDGTVDITVTGGTMPYTYSWSNQSSDEDQMSVGAGMYDVTITDGNGCMVYGSYTVSEPTELMFSALVYDVTCFGLTDGWLDVIVSGGTAPYSYGDFTGLGSGTYEVIVTDANGCIASGFYNVNEPADLLVGGAYTNVSCFGGSDGTIDLTVSGGTMPYTYSWSNQSTNEDLLSVGAGTYEVMVTDANGCMVVASYTITEPTELMFSAVVYNVTCFGSSDGWIEVTVSGGTAPYSYEDFTALGSGTYEVIVTDANGCTASGSYTVNEPAELTLTGTTVDISCFGYFDGSIDITVMGGTMPYTYSWSNQANSEDLFNLGMGIYEVFVTDANGCVVSGIYNIVENSLIMVNSTTVNVSCNSFSDGSIDIFVSGGSVPYSFSWNNQSTNEDLYNLGAGTYEVIVTDANGCNATGNSTISEPEVLSITAITADVSCFGQLDGTIDISVMGGTQPYIYSWSNQSSDEDQMGLVAGTYEVIVTDANGCIVTGSYTIIEPMELTLSATTVDVSCYGYADGSIDITVMGGTMPYSYDWSNSGVSEDLNNIGAGAYEVIITDASGCVISGIYTITEPAGLDVAVVTSDVSCFGGADGAIELSVTGGTSPYSYSWSNQSTDQNISGLTAGTYEVVITDNNGCSIVMSYVIFQPAQLIATGVKTNVSCYGGSNGSIDLSLSGGTAPYMYLWSNQSTDQDIIGLTAGTYDVTITDSHGCVAANQFIITQPPVLVATGIKTKITCNGLSNGAINLTVTGGVSPYTFYWTNSATTEDLFNLAAGPYAVIVTDANGCNVAQSFVLAQPVPLVVTGTVNNIGCNGQTNGSITTNVSGGQAPYIYNWSTGATTSSISGLGQGTYTVTVTGSKGCQSTASFTVNEPAPLMTNTILSHYGAYNVSSNGASDGMIICLNLGGTTPYYYQWANGSTSYYRLGLSAGNYSVTITDFGGCTQVLNYTLSEPPAFTPLAITSVVVSNFDQYAISCNGGSNGSVNVTVAGGVAPLSYLWSNGSTTEDLTGLPAGSYTLTVTDYAGVSVTTNVVLNQPTAITTAFNITDVTCVGTADGSLVATASGGVGPYNYNWSNGVTNPGISGISAGTYFVTVTDSHGCNSISSAIVGAPVPIVLSFNITNPACTDNGSVDLSVTGGQSPYTFNWSNGETTEDISGIVAGSYAVLVVDNSGCSNTGSAVVSSQDQLQLSIIETDISCNGNQDGNVDLTVSGGLSPYSFAWSNQQTSEDISSLLPGTYGITVTDAAGCVVEGTADISEPEAIATSFVSVNVTCSEGTNGSIDLSVSGGLAPYSYSWSNGSNTEDISNIQVVKKILNLFLTNI